jgi:hypothetical protein
MDESTVQQLQNTMRDIQDEGEDELIRQTASTIIPGFNTLPNDKLARNSNIVWSNAVPVSLNPTVLATPLPTPKPKPDLAFGSSLAAFNEYQNTAVDFLVLDHFGCSYAIPDHKLRFPFLNVEFKS